jgi:hypothetical protein
MPTVEEAGDPQAREDRRQRHRQLDPEEDLPRAHAHALRRLDGALWHLFEPREDVAVDEDLRVGRERHDRRGEAAPVTLMRMR